MHDIFGVVQDDCAGGIVRKLVRQKRIINVRYYVANAPSSGARLAAIAARD
jgi:hypothetical protein